MPKANDLGNARGAFHPDRILVGWVAFADVERDEIRPTKVKVWRKNPIQSATERLGQQPSYALYRDAVFLCFTSKLEAGWYWRVARATFCRRSLFPDGAAWRYPGNKRGSDHFCHVAQWKWGVSTGHMVFSVVMAFIYLYGGYEFCCLISAMGAFVSGGFLIGASYRHPWDARRLGRHGCLSASATPRGPPPD